MIGQTSWGGAEWRLEWNTVTFGPEQIIKLNLSHAAQYRYSSSNFRFRKPWGNIRDESYCLSNHFPWNPDWSEDGVVGPGGRGMPANL